MFSTNPSPKTLDTKGAAIYTGWSESYFRKARCQGKIAGQTPGPPFLKHGRKILYLIEDLDNWLNQHRREPV